MKTTLTVACFCLKSAWQVACRPFSDQFRRLSTLRSGSLRSALTALLLAPLAVEILAAENLPTDHPVDMRGQGRDLQSGLEKLWDYGDIAKEALDAEVISSRIQDGYKIDAVYINGAGGGEKGKDRIFCYYARPLAGGRKVPVMLDLTGGSKDDGKALYLAKKIRGACIDLEWRCTDAAMRSTFPPLRGRTVIFGHAPRVPRLPRLGRVLGLCAPTPRPHLSALDPC